MMSSADWHLTDKQNIQNRSSRTTSITHLVLPRTMNWISSQKLNYSRKAVSKKIQPPSTFMRQPEIWWYNICPVIVAALTSIIHTFGHLNLHQLKNDVFCFCFIFVWSSLNLFRNIFNKAFSLALKNVETNLMHAMLLTTLVFLW